MGVDLASALAPRIWQCDRSKSWYKKRQLKRWYFLPDVYIITRRNAARVRSSYGKTLRVARISLAIVKEMLYFRSTVPSVLVATAMF